MTPPGSHKTYGLGKLTCGDTGQYVSPASEEGALPEGRAPRPSGTLAVFYTMIEMAALWVHTQVKIHLCTLRMS